MWCDHTLHVASIFLSLPPVPEGSGKGTYKATNGIRATEHLIRAEQLTPHTPPFSWVLFRPPWASNNMCCKACVCQRMKDHCANVDTVSDKRLRELPHFEECVLSNGTGYNC